MVRKYVKAASGAAAAGYAGVKRQKYIRKAEGIHTKGRTTNRGNTRRTTKSTPGLIYGSYKSSHEQIVKPPPSGLSHSYASLIYNKKPIIKTEEKLLEPCVQKIVNPIQYIASSGLQGVNINVNLSQNPYNTTLSPSLDNQFSSALRYLNTTGSYVGNPILQAGQRSMKFLVSSMTYSLMMSNMSLGSCEVEIYDLISKVSTASVLLPNSQWTAGLVDEDVSALSPTINQYGSVPTSSKAFNLTWKIVKRTKVELGPGRSHEHLFTQKPNIIMDSEYLRQFNQIKGITSAMMIVQKGLIGDSVVGTTSGVVTTTETKLDCILTTTTTVRAINSIPRHFISINNLTTGATVVNVVNEGSGGISNTVNTEA